MGVGPATRAPALPAPPAIAEPLVIKRLVVFHVPRIGTALSVLPAREVPLNLATTMAFACGARGIQVAVFAPRVTGARPAV